MVRPVDDRWEESQGFGSYATQGVSANPNGSEVQRLVFQYGNYQPYGHAGTDLACPVGTEVRAMKAGTVVWAGWGEDLPGDNSWGPNGYFKRWGLYKTFPGICTVVKRDGDFRFDIYGHLSSNDIAPVGTHLNEGQVLGLSGNTKSRTEQVAPHLHVATIADPWNYSTAGGLIFGCEDPAPYFAGSINVESSTITPLKEGFLMALTDKQQEDIYWFLCAPDGREYLAELVGGRAADKTLNTPVKRYGSGLGGETNLAGFLAWNDAHVDAIVNAVAAVAPSADLEAIKAAVREGLAAGVNVTATVSVDGKAGA